MTAQGVERLSPRELEVLEALINNEGQLQAARSLGIAPQTIKNHLTSIHKTLGVSNSLRAAVLYDRVMRRNGEQTIERRSGRDRRSGQPRRHL